MPLIPTTQNKKALKRLQERGGINGIKTLNGMVNLILSNAFEGNTEFFNNLAENHPALTPPSNEAKILNFLKEAAHQGTNGTASIDFTTVRLKLGIKRHEAEKAFANIKTTQNKAEIRRFGKGPKATIELTWNEGTGPKIHQANLFETCAIEVINRAIEQKRAEFLSLIKKHDLSYLEIVKVFELVEELAPKFNITIAKVEDKESDGQSLNPRNTELIFTGSLEVEETEEITPLDDTYIPYS